VGFPTISPRIIGFEASLVKALHPLTAISPRIELAPDRRIDVEHELNGSGDEGPPSATRPTSIAPTVDAAAAAFRALKEPLNFPPLSAGTVPSDRLAIAVDETAPSLAGVVRGTIDAAIVAGIEPDAISIVAVDAATLDAVRSELKLGVGNGIDFVAHDPDDEANLCFAGTILKGERLLVNRTIFEADIVLPIGCARLPEYADGGIFSSLFPRFSDAETIGRFRMPSHLETAKGRAAARRRVEDAGWLLGVPMVIEVVPGGGGRVLDVVAGEPRAVAAYCERKCRERWSFRAARRASLVIASVTGGAGEQNWGNIGRALAVTDGLVAVGGAVAICSDLEADPGPTLGRLLGDSDWESFERAARSEHESDSWPAWQLARALQRGPVYFLSQLADDVVEDMGLAPITDFDQLARLASHHESCLVLDDSHYAVATVVDEP
jgi:nickel-dependent lactate racemase